MHIQRGQFRQHPVVGIKKVKEYGLVGEFEKQVGSLLLFQDYYFTAYFLLFFPIILLLANLNSDTITILTAPVIDILPPGSAIPPWNN